MLNKEDEQKLLDWVVRQKASIKEKMGIDVKGFEVNLEMNKSLKENRDIIAEKLKQKVLEAQGLSVDTSTHKVRVVSPFKDISNAEYKNIKKQLAEQQQEVAFSVSDVGKDATEEVALTYLKSNYGLELTSLEDSKINPKDVHKAEQEKARLEHLAQIEKQRDKAEQMLQEKAKAIMTKGGSALLEKADEIHKYFREQNLGCEHITLLSQFGLFGLGMKYLFEGSGGIGKSRATVEQLERFGEQLQDNRIKILSGHITPLQMYEILYRHSKEKDLLVCDEGFFIVNEEQIQQMLKDALFRGKVYWQSSKLPDGLPDEFKWNGSIIINANSLQKRTDPNAQAFLDRLCVFKIVLTNDEIITKINSSRTFKFNKELEKVMVERIFAVRSGQVKEEMTEADMNYVYEFVTNEVKFLLTTYSHISFRTVQKCINLYQAFKLYFGGMNEHTKDWFEIIGKDIVKGNTTENFIVATIGKAKGRMKSVELCQLIQAHYGVGRTQAYEKIKLLKEAGLIDGNREIILTHTAMARQ